MDPKLTSDRIAKQFASIRRRKIERLRKKITSGRYAVNNMELAKALFMARE